MFEAERRTYLLEDIMKTITTLTFIAILGLITSCSINPHPMDMTQAIEHATTRNDHEALAKHYDDAASELQKEVDSHRKMLVQYERNKSLYGKQAQSLISHCKGLVRAYEQAVAENRSMAESHRQMASDVK